MQIGSLISKEQSAAIASKQVFLEMCRNLQKQKQLKQEMAQKYNKAGIRRLN